MNQIEHLCNFVTDTQISILKIYILLYDVIMTSYVKQWEMADVSESRQMTYHSKVIGENLSKM